jgi:type VI protein secretion system component Hcp
MPITNTGGGSVRLYALIGKLEGESSQESWKSKQYSDILSFSVGAGASWSFESGKSASGGTSFGGLTISLPILGCTPQLFIGCLKEKQLEAVEIAVGGDTIDSKQFMIRLEKEVRILSCSIDGSQGSQLMMSVTFTAPIVKVEHLDRKKKDDIDFNKIAQKNDKL